MTWPTPQDYNEAIQNLRQNCSDPELAAGQVQLTPLGLPRPITGNFASVYHVRCDNRDLAVRCFWREYADMQQRYQAISRHLERIKLQYTVGFEYLAQGIRVHGTWYPILKMEWIEGELLSAYVERRRQDATALKTLAGRWREMILALENAEIAHGDLQHGNVLVVGDRLKLVDYDCMYVPALAGRGSHELGHHHYQHPRRGSGDFGPTTDRFSALAIHISLLALTTRPELWTELSAGDECLLLRKDDFLRPDESEALRLVATKPDRALHDLLAALRLALTSYPSRAPSLESVLASSIGEERAPSPCFSLATALWREVVPRGREALSSPPIAASGPAWLHDHLSPSVERVEFQSPAVVPRAVAALMIAGFIALFLTSLLALTPAVLVAGACLLLLLATLVTFLLSFHREPAVEQLRRVLRRERRVLRIQAALKLEERGLERRLLHVEDRRRAQNELMWRRLASLDEHERRDLAAVVAEVESARRDAAMKHDELTRHQREETEALLSSLQSRQLAAYLRGLPLRAAQLPHVSRPLLLRLWVMGIRTAADVTAERIQLIRAIDPEANRSISTWRVEKELEGRRSAPRVLPAATLASLAERYTADRERIDDRVRKRELDAEALSDAITQRYQRRREAVQSEQTTAERESELSRADLAKSIDSVRARGIEPSRELAQIRRELETFEGISLGRFLRTILLP